MATAAAAAPTAELPSAADVHASLDGDGDGCVTEAELRAAAEARGIELTEEQVQAFMALEADGDCVGLEAFLNSVDESEEGYVGVYASGFNYMNPTVVSMFGDDVYV